MYLSRVEIDVNNWRNAKKLTQLSAFHNWVERSFPDEIDSKEQMLHLWRLDRLVNKNYLLIVSQNKPDSILLSRFGVDGTVVTKNYDKFLDNIEPNQLMNFQLTANPSFESAEGKVTPSITVKDQAQWLIEQAEKAGFQLKRSEFKITSREWPVVLHRDGRRVRLSRVTFMGKLRVKDVNLFKQALTSGIGLEKTFGMGLMTAIPLAE
ncbi:type I-E CRISPR-associated protein Cas6/Cse3/CasE [Lactobacillus sp. ESL0679]|uniref:type I-E CRISPR-associated protein Cas6/Cse3/CasE n=1 Tax=Lactobacillus sp. ESL0679 TaxID=2983209 RepID=UPI0023F7A5B7|nr:type I-E CRISPR-associated protein Cas6/Cse3/CasE [Lactobacillus sp. ESL0679]MDF7682366.1 type I-E CRISPR-associated protein Cas6/Cse3/CasE [Lactobacillus sp. ESL0679]